MQFMGEVKAPHTCTSCADTSAQMLDDPIRSSCNTWLAMTAPEWDIEGMQEEGHAYHSKEEQDFRHMEGRALATQEECMAQKPAQAYARAVIAVNIGHLDCPPQQLQTQICSFPTQP